MNPARGDDRGSTLCALELASCRGLELAQVVWAEVGKCMPLEPSPEEFHRIEVGRVRRQERHLNIRTGGVQVLADEFSAMCLEPVPNDQQALLDMGVQRLEKLDVLFLLDAAVVQPEQAVRTRQPGDDGDVRPVEVELDE